MPTSTWHWRSFAHSACTRELKWDLRQLAWIQSHLNVIEDEGRRRLIARILEHFAAQVAPSLEALRRQAIYNDANDYNLLVGYDQDGTQLLTGLVDFGDMCHTALVDEVANACAYAMLDKEDPLAAAEAVVAAYHRVLALQDAELALVFPLALARLGRVELAVADTGAGLNGAAPAGQGVGLAKIRERLALLYGDAADLELAANEPSGFVARIRLPAAHPATIPEAPRP